MSLAKNDIHVLYIIRTYPAYFLTGPGMIMNHSRNDCLRQGQYSIFNTQYVGVKYYTVTNTAEDF